MPHPPSHSPLTPVVLSRQQELLRRPHVHYPLLLEHGGGDAALGRADQEAAEIAIKYSGFIDRQQKQMETARVLRGAVSLLPSHRSLSLSPRFLSLSASFSLARSRVRTHGGGRSSRAGGRCCASVQVASKHARPLPPDTDYYAIKTLSMEGREKLTKFRPATVGQATRIGGVSPADITALLLHLELEARGRRKGGNGEQQVAGATEGKEEEAGAAATMGR